MFGNKSVEYKSAAEDSLELRLKHAAEQVEEGVHAMKAAEDRFASHRELSQLQRQHWQNLEIWSALKVEQEQKAK
jgi:hypothetical protein